MSKRKKLTRKERKAQRDAELASRGVQPRVGHQLNDLQEDMQPLLMNFANSPLGEAQFMEILSGSGNLADEPELNSIFVSPMDAVSAYIREAQKRGLAPEDFETMSEEEGGEAQAEIFGGMAARVLTRELRQEIMQGLDKLRARLKAVGKAEDAAGVALVQSFLRMTKETRYWVGVGLIDAILDRSLSVGFELGAASMREGTPNQSAADMAEMLERPDSIARTEALLENVPGLRRFLEKQLDKAWDDGIDAIRAGDLHLGVFTPEELEAGHAVILEVVGEDGGEADEENDEPETFTQDDARTVITKLSDTIRQLLTGQRIEQLKARLDSTLKDSQTDPTYFSFIGLLSQTFDEPDAVEDQMPLLLHIFFRELSAHSRSQTSGETPQTADDQEPSAGREPPG